MNNNISKEGHVRLKEVAERAGVSQMTVSLALRGGKALQRMSPETRDRVLAAASELGYSPNPVAKALRLGRSGLIGLYAGHGYINVRRPFFAEIVSGLQEGCEELEFDLLLHGLFHGRSSDAIYLELINGKIDGLIITVPETDPIASRLAASKFSVVSVADEVPGIPLVAVDDARGGRLIADHLAVKGHKSAIFVMSEVQPKSGRDRRDAFVERCSELGLHATVIECGADMSPENVISTALESGVTALACWTDTVARTMISNCRSMGVSVPDTLAITGFGGYISPFEELFRLTTIRANWAEVSRSAVHVLDSRLKGLDFPMKTTIPVEFVSGASA